MLKTYKKRITIDQNICHGKPCITGTRIMVSVILDNLADGLSYNEIIKEYPPVTKEDINSCISFASDLVREEELVPLQSY